MAMNLIDPRELEPQWSDSAQWMSTPGMVPTTTVSPYASMTESPWSGGPVGSSQGAGGGGGGGGGAPIPEELFQLPGDLGYNPQYVWSQVAQDPLLSGYWANPAATGSWDAFAAGPWDDLGALLGSPTTNYGLPTAGAGAFHVPDSAFSSLLANLAGGGGGLSWQDILGAMGGEGGGLNPSPIQGEGGGGYGGGGGGMSPFAMNQFQPNMGWHPFWWPKEEVQQQQQPDLETMRAILGVLLPLLGR